MKYEKIEKNNIFLRMAMWEVYGKKCLYCGVVLEPRHMQVDHIFPINENEIIDKQDKDLKTYILELKKEGFEKNSIENYVVTCSDCNNKKSNYAFKTSNFRFYHDYAARHVEKIKKKMQKYNLGISKFKKEDDSNSDFGKCNLDELFCEKLVYSTFEHVRFRYGLGDVRIDAFLPGSYNERMSCSLSFKELYQVDIVITYDEDIINEYLFSGYQSEIKENHRKWCVYYDILGEENFFEIQLPHIRLKVSEEVANQMAKICDSLYEEYLLQEMNIVNVLGAEGFPKISRDSYILFGVRSDLFNKLWEYMLEHRYDSKNDIEKCIFNIPYYKKDFFSIQQNINHDQEDEVSIYANINLEKRGDYYNFIWKPGSSTMTEHKMLGFDNEIKWTAFFTYKKFIEQVIPDAIWEDELKNRSIMEWLFQKKSKVVYDEKYLINHNMIISYYKDTEEC